MLQCLFRLARSSIGRFLTRWVFAHMTFAIPVNRLRETDTLIAFQHPAPSHPVHILLVPKRAYRMLLDVPPDATDFLRDLVEAVQSLVREYDLESAGYRLITNGGVYQDVPHLHFHLIAERSSAAGDQPLP